MNENNNPIREEWERYYNILEAIRKSGITNMFGSSPVLRELCPELSASLSNEILCNWIYNYTELNKKYNWQ